MRDRNCDGTGDPIILGGVSFDICPVKALGDHPDLYDVFQLYVDCCGFHVFDTVGMSIGMATVKHLPFEGTIQDQPNIIIEAFRVIAHAVQGCAPYLVKKGE